MTRFEPFIGGVLVGVTLVATVVTLPFIALALGVKRLLGHEPVNSLDPEVAE